MFDCIAKECCQWKWALKLGVLKKSGSSQMGKISWLRNVVVSLGVSKGRGHETGHEEPHFLKKR